jgi:tetratricopeptide (TPR) repeat protein
VRKPIGFAANYFLLNQKLLFRQTIQQAIQDNPRDERSYYLAGRFAYEVDERFSPAANYFSQAVALDDRDYKAHYYLGLTLKKLNRPADASEDCMTIEFINPALVLICGVGLATRHASSGASGISRTVQVECRRQKQLKF